MLSVIIKERILYGCVVVDAFIESDNWENETLENVVSKVERVKKTDHPETIYLDGKHQVFPDSKKSIENALYVIKKIASEKK